MNSPYLNYPADFFSVEYRVNGIWNVLLSRAYAIGAAAGNFIVCPEAYPRPEMTGGKAADLLVCEIMGGFALSTAKCVFEGKGSNGDSFENILDQLELWLADAALHQDIRCWVIGARGAVVKFWMWNNIFNPKRWQAGALADGDQYYDITNNADWANVEAILTWIGTHPA